MTIQQVDAMVHLLSEKEVIVLRGEVSRHLWKIFRVVG